MKRVKAKELLVELRYDADQIITNAAGDRVWLKQAFKADGKPDYLTDCCEAQWPCEYHAKLSHRQVKTVQ